MNLKFSLKSSTTRPREKGAMIFFNSHRALNFFKPLYKSHSLSGMLNQLVIRSSSARSDGFALNSFRSLKTINSMVLYGAGVPSVNETITRSRSYG